MTRKDYKLIAAVVENFGFAIMKDDLVEALIAALYMDNPRFDDNKFRKACGTEVLVS